MSIVYYDGAFMAEGEARVPITDRGFLFGDGAYATIQVRDGVPLFFDVHMDRLREQCLGMNIDMKSVSLDLIKELIRLNHAESGVWRMKIIMTGGDDIVNRLPRRSGRLVITIRSEPAHDTHPLKMGVFPCPFYLCHSSFKSLAHLNRYYVMEEAKRQGMDDCITLTEKGIVLEASFGNLFWISGDVLFTPSRNLPLYFGVTIGAVVDVARSRGYGVEEVEVGLDDLPEGASYFRTNSMGGVRPICEIAGKKMSMTNQVLFCEGVI